MFRGGFEPLPAPLGGDGGVEGLTAAQHGRICADLLAAWRTQPLAVVFVASDGTMTGYLSRAGSGIYHTSAPTVSKTGTGDYRITWASYYETEDELKHPWHVTSAVVSPEITGTYLYGYASTTSTTIVDIETKNSSGTNVDAGFTIEVYGSWGPRRSLGDYSGSTGRKDDTREHPVPYAAQIYEDLKQQRGSAYTQKAGTLVHAENLTIARTMSSASFRLAEKYRNNAIGPAKSDEALPYWSRVLGLSQGPDEDKFKFRDRLAIHFKPSKGATYDNMVSEFSTLLGDAFVSITRNHDDEFESPPATTYWPVINPGPDTYDIGGGAWLSERAQVIINVQQPGGMSEGEFHQLVNVSLFRLVDTLLPAWCTAQWQNADSLRIVWDGAGITWDGTDVTWDNLFDWNS